MCDSGNPYGNQHCPSGDCAAYPPQSNNHKNRDEYVPPCKKCKNDYEFCKTAAPFYEPAMTASSATVTGGAAAAVSKKATTIGIGVGAGAAAGDHFIQQVLSIDEEGILKGCEIGYQQCLQVNKCDEEVCDVK